MREFHPESVSSILVIRLYFIGDVLLSTPVLEALGRRFPEASLAVVVKRRALDILRGNPFVDEVIVYDAVPRYHSPVWTLRLARELRSRRFSVSVDLTGDRRSSWMVLAADPAFRVGVNRVGMGYLLDRRTPYRAEGHVVDHLLSTVEPLGAHSPDPSPRMYLSEEERSAAAALLTEVFDGGARPTVALGPGANRPGRRWPAERFGAVAAWMMERFGVGSLVLGSAADAELAATVARTSGGAAVSLAGRTDIRLAAAVAEASSLFVGNDSGPMHIAAAVGTPVVGLFGPSNPERFSPRGAPSRVLYRGLPCSPCDQRGFPSGNDGCMRRIALEDVQEAVVSLIEEVGIG